MNNDKQEIREERVMAMARQLPAEVMPERDLWPGIASEIADAGTHAGERAWPRRVAQAAAVLLLIGGSSGMTWLALQDDSRRVATAVDGGGLTFEPVSGSFGSQYTLGPDFQDARDSLAGRLDDELTRLPPATRAEVEKNMAAIRAAIAEINRALAEEPDNALLQELLISSYNEELAIMRKVDVIASAAMHRTDI